MTNLFTFIFISRPEESEPKTIGGRTRRSSRKSDPPESATVAPSSGAKMSPVPETSLSSPKRDKSPPKSAVKQTPEKAKIPSSPKAKIPSSPRSSDKSPPPVVKEKSDKASKKIEEEKSTSPLKDKSPTRSASSTPHRKQKKAPEDLENKVLEEPLVKEKSEIIDKVKSPRRGEKILSPSAAEKQSPEKADRIRPSRSDKSPTPVMVKPQKPEKANSPSTKTDMNAPVVKQKSDKIRSPSPKTLESTVTPKVHIFFLVKSQCSILDLMIFTIFLKVQDPSPPANKQTLEKPAKMSSPQRSDKSPPPTVGKRKTSDKPKRSLQIQLEKLPEPFQEKASESLSKPTPKSSSSLDADQKSNESKVISNFVFQKKN